MRSYAPASSRQNHALTPARAWLSGTAITMLATIVHVSFGSVRCNVLQTVVYLFAFFGFLVPLPGFFLDHICCRQHLLPDGCFFSLNFLKKTMIVTVIIIITVATIKNFFLNAFQLIMS